MSELNHVGVLGMRWGRRKGVKKVSQDHAVASKIKKKKLSEMSNEEIKILSNRIRLEQEYKNLNPSKVKRGALLAKASMVTIGQVVSAVSAVSALAGMGKKIYEMAKERTNI